MVQCTLLGQAVYADQLTHCDRDEDSNTVPIYGEQLQESIAIPVASPPQDSPESNWYKPRVQVNGSPQHCHLMEVELPTFTLPERARVLGATQVDAMQWTTHWKRRATFPLMAVVKMRVIHSQKGP